MKSSDYVIFPRFPSIVIIHEDSEISLSRDIIIRSDFIVILYKETFKIKKSRLAQSYGSEEIPIVKLPEMIKEFTDRFMYDVQENFPEHLI